ncbi:MAG TPA: methyltransferase domain-containing protein [Methylomirabilota bacterium]|nr:methyltransferase domain-containing protein [Methylomirabilota bacterium]
MIAAAAPPGVGPAFWSLVTADRLAGADVVDVGTGSGRVALALAPGCRHVVGVDRDTGALEEGRRRARDARLTNLEFVEADVEARADYLRLGSVVDRPTRVVAHLCMSEAIIAATSRSLAAGDRLIFAALHADQWRETGRRSRFAYDTDEARRQLEAHGFTVEHLDVEREVQTFDSVEQGLAAAIGLAERWKTDGRWFRYIKFLEDGGRTLTRSHLVAQARRR